jgi:hypothetical protein
MVTWEQAADNGMIKLLLDECRGIYIPRDFAANFDGWQGISADDEAILLDPDHEYYWEAWDEVLGIRGDGACYIDEHGHKWTLYQDGDLFAVRDDAEIDWDSE